MERENEQLKNMKNSETELMDDIDHVKNSQYEQYDAVSEISQNQVQKGKFINDKNDFIKGIVIGLGISLIIMALIVSTTIGNGVGLSRNSGDSKFDEIKRIVKENYLYGDEVKDNKLKTGMYKGYVLGLGDPYSEYYSTEEYKTLKELTSGHFFGIGAQFRQEKDGKIKVVRVYENSPAKDGGIKPGDELIGVDGKKIGGRRLQDVVKDIKGNKDTKVSITVYRSETRKTLEKTLTRKDIIIDTVSYELLDNKIGYIKISEFTSETYNQYEKAVKELEKKGMKGLIVDLRDNPGGVIRSTAEILDSILPKGKIVYTKDKYGRVNNWNSDDEHKFTKPIAVLINGNSASASEIFAGAIQDYKAGTVIGEKSYGKGIVQQIMDLSDGSGIKLTVSEYYTPKGRRLHKVGVSPDIEVKSNEDGKNQLQRAIEEIKKKI